MNIKRAIHLLLQKLSMDHKVFYMEKRYYINSRCSKSFLVKIDDNTLEFKAQLDLLEYLKKEVM